MHVFVLVTLSQIAISHAFALGGTAVSIALNTLTF